MAPPPSTEQQLLDNALSIAGFTLEMIAQRFSIAVPHDLKRNKGWVGQLLETALGATAGSKAEPDFQLIGVELKTIPLNKQNKPKETTYVCTTPLLPQANNQWQQSIVYKKLSRVLWVPIEADGAIPIAQRRVGNAILWSPSAEQEAVLQRDWQELMDMVLMGQLEMINARMGQVLQIRPKAANAKSLCWGLSESGEKILTLPRGFYLRQSFTAKILKLGDV